ncbi:hypothetical protein BV25DRAFT_1913732 [Artomyces pyxidatus]|uniref:Uncharacterized protein n=1 Tax=Artomyces pyxidatus TaxID=48021 RepID=A0ACB8TAM1_9AGAM|nr:hypothetical protein BV25DRAFT_1913732 [Artomyces pyxidatus]
MSPPVQRRRSVDSSSSWDEVQAEDRNLADIKQPVPPSGAQVPSFPEPEPSPSSASFKEAGSGPSGDRGLFSGLHSPHFNEKPPAYSAHQAIPPSGFRVPLGPGTPFPPPQQAGNPPFRDADGRSPVFIGSAIFPNSVHPCKINPNLQPPCRVPYGGGEHEHHGRYDLLPFTPDTMEFVRTSHGRIPLGRRPVEGGYEDHGAKLYHAIAQVQGVMVPGKTAEHLGGCNIAFGGGEHIIRDNYEILCWRS